MQMKLTKGSKREYQFFTICFLSIFTLCFSIFTYNYTAASTSVDDEVFRIQGAYENIQDMSGSFIQKSNIKDLKRTDTFNGNFYIKRPMRMKWSYKGENAQEVFIKDQEIIIYQKRERQALRSNFNRETYGQAPISLLSGFANIQEEFNISKINKKLLLKPKKPMGGVISIEIVLSDDEFPISSFTIHDPLSNTIEMTLKNIRINTGLEDKIFEPSLPKDITIYEFKP